ncbi:DUF2834 domain-containing protein [Synechococcus sp. PCC 6312]|uniref:DUF2834 domain-containing protein n=1 Tax=Synechococcus sp. (strain ATCC 27167 / PCC 6312) TaxID=195253 RepID=UPI0002E7B3B5|nr:DUF2834 domain-containing protein [Synechococcus sp. PCC 6312]
MMISWPRTKLQLAYLCLCLLGTVLPVAQLVRFIKDYGLDVVLFFQQVFANPAASMFGFDVGVSLIALWALILVEGRRLNLSFLWLPLVASVTVGVSLGLPLFLLIRQSHLD